ncbi:hypothetical protein D3C77_429830 [compost metagenome]
MLHGYFLIDLLIAKSVSAFIDWSPDYVVEVLLHLRQFNTILRTFRTCKTRYDRSEIQLD